jgi:hypothetical protein
MHRIVPFFASIVSLTLLASQAWAWGNDGHRITGHIASAFLNAHTRIHLRRILGHDDLSLIAAQMDEARDSFEVRHPGAARWHYENRLVCGGGTSCPQGHCVTRQIDLHVRKLREAITPEAKAEAIVVVVHLIGDLHQPLHLADNRDRGGNDRWVMLPGERDRRRLHEVWDTRIVKLSMHRRSASAQAAALMQRFDAEVKLWKTGTVTHWAAESYQAGREKAYLTLPQFACATAKAGRTNPVTLSSDYVASAERIVSEQLMKAGIRIAAVLNTAFDKQAHPR